MSAIAALIGLGGSALGAGASIFGSMGAQGRNQQSTQIARDQLALQAAIQWEQQRSQREMQTASQTDANGNKLIYHPGQGWIPLLSERGQADLSAANAAKDLETRKYFGRGQYEDQEAFRRRQGEGDAARPLLDAIRYGYGAPSREGTIGAQKIAGVTGAGENTEALKEGASAAALRSNSGPQSLSSSFSSLDRAGASGTRTALAQADANGSPLFNQIMADWQNQKLSPYQKLATSANNTGNVPMPAPSTGSLDAQTAARAARPMTVNPYAGATLNSASKNLTDSINGMPQANYGGAITAFTQNAKNLYDMIKQQNEKPPWNEDSRNDHAYNDWRF